MLPPSWISPGSCCLGRRNCRTVLPFGANLQLPKTSESTARGAASPCTTLHNPTNQSVQKHGRRLVDHHYFALCITSSPCPTSQQSRHAPLHSISNCARHGSRSPLSSHSFTCEPHPRRPCGETLLPPSVRSRVKRSPGLAALPSFSACELCR